MKRFHKAEPCPKCGNCFKSIKYQPDTLVCTCTECEYKWEMAPLDKVKTSKDLWASINKDGTGTSMFSIPYELFVEGIANCQCCLIIIPEDLSREVYDRWARTNYSMCGDLHNAFRAIVREDVTPEVSREIFDYCCLKAAEAIK